MLAADTAGLEVLGTSRFPNHEHTQNHFVPTKGFERLPRPSVKTKSNTCTTDLVSNVLSRDGKKPPTRQCPRGVLFSSSASASGSQDEPSLADDANRFELFLLQDGEKKITETPFPRKSDPYLDHGNVALSESTCRGLTGAIKACQIAPISP